MDLSLSNRQRFAFWRLLRWTRPRPSTS